MADITFTREQTQRMARKIQDYLEQNLSIELEDFDAEFLLEFISRELGAHYYNQGINDAIAQVEAKMLDITDSVLWLEKPVQD
ncbi:DUF2164 domain-containing protein [Yersinia sp. 2544 StPb PI]|jgi:uncharacterized protein (DUF2164 family)|uniref:DUF2164 family protein n=1 Tax=Yersinia intermedia TaxID=631 RepID=A0ABX6FAQ6_YERIN|nr:DUF2164 domain-containing protein [Yersinia intermedia]PNM23766.1 DUF2164 domain-containing protein [Yersinia enterocolitica]EEQ17508.1 hypothetical protein yinte0001_18320 [Yersinia intermedia ATCC 29909]MCB5311544.1 DUF2164 domain-containing protein [Yersinia intermedia]MCB5320565.1 DUF2164 domain-containing protein [Yersinia intermedia]MCB5325409.1 DUF2164 domain-containing protein [Yersinia intermedia]